MGFDANGIEEQPVWITRTSCSETRVDAVLCAVGALQEALAPVIGRRGVAALYARSVDIARRSYPWLPTENDGSLDDLRPLRCALANRGDDDMAQGAAAILSAFNSVLVSLIGIPMAARLIGHVSLLRAGVLPLSDEGP